MRNLCFFSFSSLSLLISTKRKLNEEFNGFEMHKASEFFSLLHLIRCTLYFCVLFAYCCCRQFLHDSEQMTKIISERKGKKSIICLLLNIQFETVCSHHQWMKLLLLFEQEHATFFGCVCIRRFGWDKCRSLHNIRDIEGEILVFKVSFTG